MNLIRVTSFSIHYVTIEPLIDYLKTNCFIKICENYNCLNSLKIDLSRNISGVILLDDSCINKEDLFDFLISTINTYSFPRIIIYSGSNDPEYFKKIINLRIRGIIHHKSEPAEILSAIKQFNSSGLYIDHLVDILISNQKISVEINSITIKKLLSKRELEVLELIYEGLENKAISKRLFISVKTIETHKEKIKLKLGIKTVKELYMIKL